VLDRVAGPGGGGRFEVRRARDPADVADAVGEPLADALRVELGLAPEQLERPDRAQLGELLVERHPGEEVGDARVDRQRGVAVAGVDRRHQPFTAPRVSPPMSCRSATR
jgi:hypothetical protein